MRRLMCFFLFAIAIPSPRGHAEPLNLSVMSFNVRYGFAADGENAWNKRKDILIHAIAEQDPDLLGTQECIDFQAAYMVEQLPKYRRIGIDRDATGKGETTSILYKHEVLLPIESGNFWLSESPETPASKSWDTSLTRMATWVRFYHIPTKRMFYCFNTHFDHRGEIARQESAKLLLKRIQGIDAGMPVILTGDFNAYAEQSKAWQTFMDGGLKDAWAAAKERSGPDGTFSSFKAPNPDNHHRIDWILLRGSVEVAKCLTVTYNEDGRFPSDHYPVAARISIP